MNCKLFVCFILAVSLLTGCGAGTEIQSDPYQEAYVYVKELYAKEQVDRIDWDEILPSVPEDHYIEYPGLHSIPLTATLYKNNECTEIDVTDPRLVKLLNFYNNMVYNEVYSITQGSFSPQDYDEFTASDFRLELTYSPNWTDGSFETTFDKMLIVENFFLGVRSDTPFGEYPFSSFGRFPLYTQKINWLDLFGF
jgi:hypothetical protein